MPDKKKSKGGDSSAGAATEPDLDNADADDGADKPVKKKDKKDKAEKVEMITLKRTALGDTATIKRLMDDAAVHIFLDETDGYGYVEDTTMSNLKLVVGFLAVSASGVSHAYPATFPKNWLVLLLCCAWYFGMSGILQLLLSFVELESVVVLRGKGTKLDGSRADGINVSSHFPRFQEIYTLGVTPVPGSATSLHRAPRFRPDVAGGNTEAYCLQRSWSVEAFFDEEGIFAEEAFMQVVKDFVSEYQQMLKVGGASKKDK